MENLTIIYYTANTEKPEFEKKIINNLLIQKGSVPIISVSRKPMDLGKNICIGEQPVCYSNEWKQLLIGLKEADTEFCIAAESDCLYPPENFTFTPPVNNMVYRYNNVWAFWEHRRKYWKKPRCEGAQMCGREFWIERLEAVVGWHKGWEPMGNPNKMVVKIFDEEAFWTGAPVVTFKTRENISYKTSLVKVDPVEYLPYWGNAHSLYERMFR